LEVGVNKFSKKQKVLAVSCLVFCLTTATIWEFSKTKPRELTLDEKGAQAILNNDLVAFKSFIKAGGKPENHFKFQASDSSSEPVGVKAFKKDQIAWTIAEALVAYERVEFIEYLQQQKISFVKQSSDGKRDIVSLAVESNNPQVFKAILKENPDLTKKYGEEKKNLLHIASKSCSANLADLLHNSGKFSAQDKQKDGATALTIAASSDCVPMITFWQGKNEDFAAKDGKGKSAIQILKENKSEIAAEIAKSIKASEAIRKPASVTVKLSPKVPDFYKLRKYPKDVLADPSLLVDPEIRPLDSDSTAEYTEFAD
jgi:hypothetical protein